MEVTLFFNAGKLGVSIVIRSEDQLKIDKCSAEVLEFVNQKKIEVVVRLVKCFILLTEVILIIFR